MQFRYLIESPSESAAEALIVPVGSRTDDLDLQTLTGVLGVEQTGELASVASRARFRGKPESTFLGQTGSRTVILTGVGEKKNFTSEVFMRAVSVGVRAGRDRGATELAIALPDANRDIDPGALLEAGALGASLGLYQFEKYRGKGSANAAIAPVVNTISFVGGGVAAAAANRALYRAQAIADGVNLARDLGNEPASTLTPESLAGRARDISAATNLSIEVLGPEDLAAIGANAMLAVGGGSVNGPRLIRLRYQPESSVSGTKVVGLVGKAITFDTGGYSIKPYEGMLEMKGDMSGGAAVLGAMSALAALDCPVPVEATICAAENMISGQAFRPGDVIEGMNGVTMEILSTDAEGRLVLADGLVDTARRGATELIDLATLTGAAVVALGEGATALFATSDELAEAILSAANATGERMWRMPLFDELEKKIKGDVADIKNTGGRGGGAITAALFLRHFDEGLPWAHLDIAGAARQDKPGAIGPRGATGVGVRTLLRYLAP